MYRSWIVACTVAEAVGMTAAAGASRAATTLTERGVAHATSWAVLVVVLGGLVEGTALGWLQAKALRDVLGPSGRRRWLLATVAVAGLGWGAGSAPAALSGEGAGGDQAPMLLIVVGAAALGAGMGALLGAAQAWALRDRVPRPWGWTGGSVGGWTAAMPVIFVGASSVGATWPWWVVIPVGTVTGLLAGAVLGSVSGVFLDRMTMPRTRRQSPSRLSPLGGPKVPRVR